MTHGLTYLPYVDKVVVMKDGHISEMGTYQELINQDAEFAKFLRTYQTVAEEKTDSKSGNIPLLS